MQVPHPISGLVEGKKFIFSLVFAALLVIDEAIFALNKVSTYILQSHYPIRSYQL